MNDRYTPEELMDYANDMEQDGLSTGADMLRQAATDATRLQSLEEELECRKGAYDGLANANAKIDALEAENARYKAALAEIATVDRGGLGWRASLARNALKED